MLFRVTAIVAKANFRRARRGCRGPPRKKDWPRGRPPVAEIADSPAAEQSERRGGQVRLAAWRRYPAPAGSRRILADHDAGGRAPPPSGRRRHATATPVERAVPVINENDTAGLPPRSSFRRAPRPAGTSTSGDRRWTSTGLHRANGQATQEHAGRHRRSRIEAMAGIPFPACGRAPSPRIFRDADRFAPGDDDVAARPHRVILAAISLKAMLPRPTPEMVSSPSPRSRA